MVIGSILAVALTVFLVWYIPDLRGFFLSCSGCKRRGLQYVGSEYPTDRRWFDCRKCGLNQTR